MVPHVPRYFTANVSIRPDLRHDFKTLQRTLIDHRGGAIMAVGKRKRRDQIILNDSPIDTGPDRTAADLQALFQQHFEAKFRPLEGVSLPAIITPVPTSPNEDARSEWEGLSDNEDCESPQVIQHHITQAAGNEMPKDELRAFMAGTPSIRVGES